MNCSSLVSILLYLSSSVIVVKACSDSRGKFSTVGSYGQPMKRTCSWVKKKAQWRCKKIMNASEKCPLTCGICDQATTSPTANPTLSSLSPTISTAPTSTTAPTISHAPSEMYDWCEDSSSSFNIDSVSWIKESKNCDWIGHQRWLKCDIYEVKIKCPKTCDVCNCFDNNERFNISDGSTKSCEWAKRKDTWYRCMKYAEVTRNCPLTCGQCTTFIYPPTNPPAS